MCDWIVGEKPCGGGLSLRSSGDGILLTTPQLEEGVGQADKLQSEGSDVQLAMYPLNNVHSCRILNGVERTWSACL